MGLLDTTIDNIDKKITRELITNPRGLDFELVKHTWISVKGRSFQIPSEHLFRKDVYIAKNGFNVYAAGSIKLPVFFQTGDEIEVSVSFIRGHYMNVESQIYITIATKMEPMKFKTNLYESIKRFLDEDNIISYLTDRLKLNLIQ